MSNIWNKQAETMKRADIEALQLERLKWTVDYCINNVKFYHDRLTPLGISGDKIKCLKDIQYIPYTTKTDLRDNYPFGLFAVPQKDIVRIHASSGTTGKPTVVGIHKKRPCKLGGGHCQNSHRRRSHLRRHCSDMLRIRYVYGSFGPSLRP